MMCKHTSMLKVKYIMIVICRSWKIHIYLYKGHYLKIKNWIFYLLVFWKILKYISNLRVFNIIVIKFKNMLHHLNKYLNNNNILILILFLIFPLEVDYKDQKLFTYLSYTQS
jgi:hypothetical protein